MRINYCFILFILLSLLLSGCALTKTNSEAGTPENFEMILATLRMRYDLVDTISTWMNVSINTKGQKEEIRASLYYEKPDKIRLDARGVFNEPRAIVLAVEDDFRIYFVAENEMIMDKLTDHVISQIFDVDIRVSDVKSSLFANPFMDRNVDNIEVENYRDEYLIRRNSTVKDFHEEITIRIRDEVVINWKVIDSEDNLQQEISFYDYKEVGGILRPLKAVINRPPDRTRITIESVDPEINVELAEIIFDLPIPDGVKIYNLSDLRESQEEDTSEPEL
ncbi:DUF4292 domain-containing protein [Candidatus Poribacteria bacterium]|nr:DUF4292 domain-containing protein [Candidatus Poribacteria bacterium]